MIPPQTEDITNIIKNLPIKEALGYLTASKIFDFVSKGCESIKKVIQDKYNEGTYAFVPNKEEAMMLKRFRNDNSYREILTLVPNYKYIDLIRTGLLIKNYNSNIENNIEKEKNSQRIGEIKKQIIKRPNGNYLLRIVKFPGTIFFSSALKYIYDLKKNGYPENQLEEVFNELVNEWEENSKFIENETQLKEVLGFCKKQLENNKSRFCLLALKDTAVNVAKETINELKGEPLIKQKNYEIKIFETGGNQLPTIEVIITKKIFD